MRKFLVPLTATSGSRLTAGKSGHWNPFFRFCIAKKAYFEIRSFMALLAALIVILREGISSDIFNTFKFKISSADRSLMSNAKTSAYTLRTPCANCPTTRRSRASSPLALTPRSVRASCRYTRARARGQQERGSPSLLTPTWTTLGCGDSTRLSCTVLPSSVLSGKYVFGCAVTCGLCSLSIWHRGHGRHAKRRLRPPPYCGWRILKALANVSRKSWFATGYAQRRVIAYQVTVYVDIFVSHNSVDRG